MAFRLAVLAFAALAVNSCGGGGGGPPPAQTYTLAGVGSVTIPAGALSSSSPVVLTQTTNPMVQQQFGTTAVMFGAAIRAPFELTVTVGTVQPVSNVQVTLEIPPSVRAAATPDDEVRVFYLNRYADTDGEELDTIEVLPPRGRPSDPTITASVPREAFQQNSSGLYEAYLFVGLTPSAPTAVTFLKNAGRRMLASVNPVRRAWAQTNVCDGVSIERPVDDSIGISSGFGPRQVRNDPNASTFHRGVDFAAPLNTPVMAVAEGRILIVGHQLDPKTGKGWGHYIVLKHANGGTSLYADLAANSATFAEGEDVPVGAVIALSGNSGNGKPHLHFEYSPDGKTFEADGRVNPTPCFDRLAQGSLTVRDNGAAADDSFSVSLNGREICQTAIGAANSCALGTLRPGTYTLTLTVLVAPDDLGTYEITMNNPRMTINGGRSAFGSPPAGTVVSYTLVVVAGT